MNIEKDYQCRACGYFFSHPVDVCPVCSDQFYWLLSTAYAPNDDQKLDYIVAMEHVVEGRVTRNFITHDNRLWLPPTYWNFDPNGEALQGFPWIDELRLYQHVASPKEPSPYDTNPGLSPFQPSDKPLSEDDGQRLSRVLKPSPTPVQARSGNAAPRSTPKQAPPRRSFLDEWFAPLMVFIFFAFLSLAYLNLKRHYQLSAVPEPPPMEAPSDE